MFLNQSTTLNHCNYIETIMIMCKTVGLPLILNDLGRSVVLASRLSSVPYAAAVIFKLNHP